MGDCVAVWPYLLMGAIIPLFAAPWLVGQVLGGLLGSLILIRVKAGFVRFLLIGFMFLSTYALLKRGLTMLNVIGNIPNWIDGIVYLVVFIWVTQAIVKYTRSGS